MIAYSVQVCHIVKNMRHTMVIQCRIIVPLIPHRRADNKNTMPLLWQTMPLKWLCLYFYYVLELDSPIWQAFIRTLIPWQELCYQHLKQRLRDNFVLDFQAGTTVRYQCPITQLYILLEDRSPTKEVNVQTYRASFFNGHLVVALDFYFNTYSVQLSHFRAGHKFSDPMQATNFFFEELTKAQDKFKRLGSIHGIELYM